MVLILTKKGKGYAGVVTRPDEMGEEEAIRYLRELKSLICPENRVFPCDLEQRLRQLGGFDGGRSVDITRRASALGLRVINGSGN